MSHNETGPCDKCGGKGEYMDRRVGDVACDECHGHGWFTDGVAGPAASAPHEVACAVLRGGQCTCYLTDPPAARPPPYEVSYGTKNPRLRNPGESVGAYRAAMGWPLTPEQAREASAAANQDQWISGVGRDAEYARCLVVYFNRQPSDDDLRRLHEAARKEFAAPAIEAELSHPVAPLSEGAAPAPSND